MWLWSHMVILCVGDVQQDSSSCCCMQNCKHSYFLGLVVEQLVATRDQMVVSSIDSFHNMLQFWVWSTTWQAFRLLMYLLLTWRSIHLKSRIGSMYNWTLWASQRSFANWLQIASYTAIYLSKIAFLAKSRIRDPTGTIADCLLELYFLNVIDGFIGNACFPESQVRNTVVQQETVVPAGFAWTAHAIAKPLPVDDVLARSTRQSALHVFIYICELVLHVNSGN